MNNLERTLTLLLKETEEIKSSWVDKAKTKGAKYRISNWIDLHNRKIVNGCEWESGTWYSGTWVDGEWSDGYWVNGVWKAGQWDAGEWVNGSWETGFFKGGVWHDGIWRNGTFGRGEWKKGVWKDGIWDGGTWHDGTWEDGWWDRGTWKIGWIKDVNKIGHFNPNWEWRGNYVRSPISPREYFSKKKPLKEEILKYI